MKTDSIFYRLFQTDPGILFELLGYSCEQGQHYDFRSIEIKQLVFRLDGVLLPKPQAPDPTIWFLEVQFQKQEQFYHRFFAEITLFLSQHPQTVDWQAAVLFPNRSVEPEEHHLYRALLNSDQVHRVYLDDLSGIASPSIGVGLVQLIVADAATAGEQAKSLLARTQAQQGTQARIAAIIELIETVVVYKFPLLSWAEIERMLGLSELKQTRVYQEALQEGREEGREEEGRSLILRQLSRRLGAVPPNLQAQVRTLSLPQLEALAEALLDFSHPADLVNWLQDHRC